MLHLAEGFEIGEIVMAPITDGPMSDDLEGSKDDARSILALGIFVACLIVLLLTIGFGIFGSETMAPNKPRPTTESPAPSSSTNPYPSRKASASVGAPSFKSEAAVRERTLPRLT